MKDITVKELKERFTLKQLQAYNSEIRSKYNETLFNYKKLEKQFEARVKTDVKKRTKELEKNYNDQLKEKDKKLKEKEQLIEEKDKQIDALKEKIARMESKMNNDASNSGLPTSKTAIGKKKYIPNSRVKTGEPKGRKEGHKKDRLKPFPEEEITETVEIIPTECNKCHSTNLEKLETSVDKQELDYVVTVVKRKNKFVNCKCKDCGNEFHANIPNDLKEPIQYGKTVQSLAVCLTNEIYTPFNKTVKLLDGITKGEIHMSEGYVTKLQKRASKFLEGFIEEVKEHISKQEVYGWDDGVVSINQKQAILRTYCTDNVALFIGHENKNEKSLDGDGILSNTSENTIVMHDHILHNYNEKYNFDNVECVRHLIRRLQKKKEETGHDWCDELKNLLSKTVHDRNLILKKKEDSFSKSYLQKLDKEYDDLIEKGKKQNKDKTTRNYFEKEEEKFIMDLIKYKRNYLLWAYNFSLPTTNNNSERNIRPIKSKLKISGQFQSLAYLEYYANIRSYIETCKKNSINIIEACVRLMDGEPYTLKEILDHEKK